RLLPLLGLRGRAGRVRRVSELGLGRHPARGVSQGSVARQESGNRSVGADDGERRLPAPVSADDQRRLPADTRHREGLRDHRAPRVPAPAARGRAHREGFMKTTSGPGGAVSRATRLVPIIAGLFGALVMTFVLGPSLVDPTNIDWLMHADYRLHFLGWHLYRGGPWPLPIGASPLLILPVGSSIGLTDAIPIVGIPLKLLSGVLPAHFQFIGLWLVLSFALQGVFGALLMQLATPR